MKQESKPISRRTFLKFAAGTGGSVALFAIGVQPRAAAQDPTEVSIAYHWEAAFRPSQEAWEAKFLERHPEITIKPIFNTWADHNNLVPTWAAAGTLPDMLYVHGSRAAPWAAENILTSVQSYVDADTEFNVDGIWPEAMRLYMPQGEAVSIPYDHGPIILGYNKDIFDAAGHPYPDETWTMDTFLEAAKTLTKDGMWGWSGTYPDFGPSNNGPMLRPWGGEMMSEDETQLTLDTAEVKDALNFWSSLIHEHKVAPNAADSEAFPSGPWQGGVVAMSNVASWDTPTLAEFAPFNWDVAPWPKGQQSGTGSFGSGFGITTASKNPDQSWTYLREYLSTEGMVELWGASGRGSPARKDAYQSWLDSEIAPDGARYFLEALETYAKTDSPYRTLRAAELLDVLSRETALIRNGEKSVDDALAAMQADGQAVLDS
jgi:multiple sugar transport system substrate-binding protein